MPPALRSGVPARRSRLRAETLRPVSRTAPSVRPGYSTGLPLFLYIHLSTGFLTSPSFASHDRRMATGKGTCLSRRQNWNSYVNPLICPYTRYLLYIICMRRSSHPRTLSSLSPLRIDRRSLCQPRHHEGPTSSYRGRLPSMQQKEGCVPVRVYAVTLPSTDTFPPPPCVTVCRDTVRCDAVMGSARCKKCTDERAECTWPNAAGNAQVTAGRVQVKNACDAW